MKKKKNLKGNLLLFTAIFALFAAEEMIPGLEDKVAGLFVLLLVALGVGWLFTRKSGGKSGNGRSRSVRRSRNRARREFLPGKLGRQAGDAFYNGAMDWLTPKEPTADEKAWQERQKAKKDYAFHSAQAEKYKGTGDGAWHEQRAKEAWNKMKR